MEDTRIHIVSKSSCQQTLLSNFLEHHTGLICSHIAETDWPPYIHGEGNHGTIILWDCLNVELDILEPKLTQFIYPLMDHFHFVLYNVTPAHRNSHSTFTEWVYGVFYENDPPDLILKGIRAIDQGEIWLSRTALSQIFLMNKARLTNHTSNAPSLTRREKEILRQVSSGASNKDIAASLFVSQYTVKTHLYNIFKKIGVTTRGQASNWASKHYSVLM